MNVLQDPVATNAAAHLIAGLCYLTLTAFGFGVIRSIAVSLGKWGDHRRSIKEQKAASGLLTQGDLDRWMNNFIKLAAHPLPATETSSPDFPRFVQVINNTNNAPHPNINNKRMLERGDILKVWSEASEVFIYNNLDSSATYAIRKKDVMPA